MDHSWGQRTAKKERRRPACTGQGVVYDHVQDLLEIGNLFSFCKFELVFALTTMFLLTLKAGSILCNIYIAVIKRGSRQNKCRAL